MFCDSCKHKMTKVYMLRAYDPANTERIRKEVYNCSITGEELNPLNEITECDGYFNDGLDYSTRSFLQRDFIEKGI